MTLPAPEVERKRMHLRRVTLEGFKRSDGLWDIEAHMVDTKDQDYLLASGLRKPGEAVHDMWVRITVDGKMNVLAAATSMDAMPYPGHCDHVPPDYSKIVGLNLFQGFLKAVKEMFGGVKGCSHLSELLMFMPTAALQSFASEVPDNNDSAQKPYQLDRCHALASHTETVRLYYPRWHRKKAGEKKV